MAGQPITLVSVSAEGRSPDGPKRGRIDAFDPARTFCSRGANLDPSLQLHFVGNLFPPRRSNEAARRAPVRRVDHANNADAPVGTGADRATTQRVCTQGGEAFRAISKEASMARTLSTSIMRRRSSEGWRLRPSHCRWRVRTKRTHRTSKPAVKKVCMSGWAAFSPSRR